MDNKEWTNFIDELKRRNDIVDVISSYSAVQQKGRRYWARCPIHNEKTPSFAINRESQSFYCFGCHKGGDVIKFIEEMESFSFMEAVEFLAKRVNLPMPQSTKTDEQIAKAKKQKDALYKVCLESARSYNANLMSPQGKKAMDYLTNRGLSKSTITTYGLGYSLGYDQLPNYLLANKLDISDCVKAGILGEKKNSGEYYDVLHNRVIVPIINASGQVIAFGGRLTEKSETQPKYRNSTETAIFEKGKNLFGINIIKKQKTTQQVENIIIVEGYMDVLALYQAGFNRVVASMGTALTKEQARLLKRYTNSVYICYDGDSAGQNATIRGLDILREEGLDVYVVTLPTDIDPDEFVRKFGAQAYRDLLNSALPLAEYKLRLIKKQFDINSENKVIREEARRKYIEKSIQLLKTLSPVEQESYMNKISLETGFTKDFIMRQSDVPTTELVPLEKKETPTLSAKTKALCYVAKASLYNKEWAVAPRPYCFEDNIIEQIFDYCDDCKAKGVPPIPSMVYQIAPDESPLIDCLLNTDLDERFSQTYYQDCIAYLHRAEIKKRLEECSAEYNQCEDDKKRELLAKITELTKEFMSIKEVILTEDKNGN